MPPFFPRDAEKEAMDVAIALSLQDVSPVLPPVLPPSSLVPQTDGEYPNFRFQVITRTRNGINIFPERIAPPVAFEVI